LWSYTRQMQKMASIFLPAYEKGSKTLMPVLQENHGQ
jgi:hypothetical protein